MYIFCRFTNHVQSTFSQCLFINTGIVLLLLSIGTLDIIMNFNNHMNALRIGFVWIAVVLYLFKISWAGQMIVDINCKILKSIYFCGWYNLPPETQYLMKFMMMRCNIPFELKAGPLLNLNVESFANVLKMSLSYFTVLLSVSQ
ncbi:PREDICTED: odorant receptor 56a [Ceratosolen solmsi marchali]|uniref:Odorant receptor 56a n=1 Tax=Ceratosolen solmsi marchali TaxID=326594 RepID=A0AAJ6YMP3_9HYME|nr:PREDICTED: odorant receptor 56a [Ceratosolen solmsi marchali]